MDFQALAQVITPDMTISWPIVLVGVGAVAGVLETRYRAAQLSREVDKLEARIDVLEADNKTMAVQVGSINTLLAEIRSDIKEIRDGMRRAER